jgi:hypothetical protein
MERPPARPENRWEDNIKIDLNVGCKVVDWIGSECSPVVGSCEHAINLHVI